MNKYIINNVDCQHCAKRIENGIEKLNCVNFVSIDFASSSMLIDTTDIKSVQNEIEKLEHGVTITSTEKKEKSKKDDFNPGKELIITSVLTILFIAGLFFQKTLSKTPYRAAEYIYFLAIYLVAGWPVHIKALRNISKGGVFDENFLMTIATIGAILIRALSEAVGVMIFYRVGEYLQKLSVHRSRNSIKALLEVRPDYANVIINKEIKTMSPEEVKIGDRVIVKPGEKIPLDGIVVSGKTQVDTSTLTGESIPKTIHTDDSVLAGMINKTSLIEIEVTKLFSESSISKILELVENASHKKAKTEQFFTTFSKYYTPFIVIIALITAIIPPILFIEQSFNNWIYRSLVILVISCPCALVISIPLAYFGGIGGASRKGILIKGSNYLDVLASVKTVIFDKTGTLTKGVFNVINVVSKSDFNKDQILELAAEAEAHSNHPIAISIKNSYHNKIDMNLIEEYHEIGGHGIKAVIDNKTTLVGNDRLMELFGVEYKKVNQTSTIVHVAVNSTYAGYLVISDELKEDTISAIEQLKKLGIKKSIMLTGDSKEIASEVAKNIGIDKFYTELLPEDKVAILENLIENEHKGEKIAFVGDGINDAPVLARADVGISMGTLGSDAAIETSDIVIMNDSLLKVTESIKIARKTKRILVENIILALGIKGIFIILGFIGVASMWEAVFGDMGVALLAIFNSTRVLRIPQHFSIK